MKYQVLITVFEKHPHAKMPPVWIFKKEQAKQMSEHMYEHFITQFEAIKAKDVTREFQKNSQTKSKGDE